MCGRPPTSGRSSWPASAVLHEQAFPGPGRRARSGRRPRVRRHAIGSRPAPAPGSIAAATQCCYPYPCIWGTPLRSGASTSALLLFDCRQSSPTTSTRRSPRTSGGSARQTALAPPLRRCDRYARAHATRATFSEAIDIVIHWRAARCGWDSAADWVPKPIWVPNCNATARKLSSSAPGRRRRATRTSVRRWWPKPRCRRRPRPAATSRSPSPGPGARAPPRSGPRPA